MGARGNLLGRGEAIGPNVRAASRAREFHIRSLARLPVRPLPIAYVSPDVLLIRNIRSKCARKIRRWTLGAYIARPQRRRRAPTTMYVCGVHVSNYYSFIN